MSRFIDRQTRNKHSFNKLKKGIYPKILIIQLGCAGKRITAQALLSLLAWFFQWSQNFCWDRKKNGFYFHSGAEVKNHQDPALVGTLRTFPTFVVLCIRWPQLEVCIYNNSISPCNWGWCAGPATEPGRSFQLWIQHSECCTSRVPQCKGK